MRHILVDRGFTYPLPETEHIRKVKSGEIPFKQAGAELEQLVEEVEDLSRDSPLPAKVDRKWWNRWLERRVQDAVWNELARQMTAAKAMFDARLS